MEQNPPNNQLSRKLGECLSFIGLVNPRQPTDGPRPGLRTVPVRSGPLKRLPGQAHSPGVSTMLPSRSANMSGNNIHRT